MSHNISWHTVHVYLVDIALAKLHLLINLLVCYN